MHFFVAKNEKPQLLLQLGIPFQQKKWSSIFFILSKTKSEEKLSSTGILPNMIIVPVFFSKQWYQAILFWTLLNTHHGVKHGENNSASQKVLV